MDHDSIDTVLNMPSEMVTQTVKAKRNQMWVIVDNIALGEHKKLPLRYRGFTIR